MQRAFGVALIRAHDHGILSVVPSGSPYFEPKRVKFRAFDCTGQNVDDMDFQIGAVTVGGSPQLAINTLTPDPNRQDDVDYKPVVSSKDFEQVNWSVDGGTCPTEVESPMGDEEL